MRRAREPIDEATTHAPMMVAMTLLAAVAPAQAALFV